MLAKERSNRSVTLRFTNDEFKALKHNADKLQQSVSEFIRFKLDLRKDNK